MWLDHHERNANQVTCSPIVSPETKDELFWFKYFRAKMQKKGKTNVQLRNDVTLAELGLTKEERAAIEKVGHQGNFLLCC